MLRETERTNILQETKIWAILPTKIIQNLYFFHKIYMFTQQV